jgi:HEAT repeat protein
LTSKPSIKDEGLIAKLGDFDPKVRIDAAFEMAQRGSGAGRDVLLSALVDRDWQVRQRAANRIGRIGPSRAKDQIAKLLDDPVSDVRNVAIFALLNIGRPSVVPSLLRALRDTDPDIREDAGSALSSLLGRAAALQLGDEVKEEDAKRMSEWWANCATGMDDAQVYEQGKPASVGTLIDALKHASPAVVESLLKELVDRTGQCFTGALREQLLAWEKWWHTNKSAYQEGRRYFYGRDVETLWN